MTAWETAHSALPRAPFSTLRFVSRENFHQVAVFHWLWEPVWGGGAKLGWGQEKYLEEYLPSIRSRPVVL